MNLYKAWLLLIFCNLFWAGNYVFGGYVVQEMTPLWMTFSRWVLAILLLFPIAHFFEKPVWRDAFKSWRPLFVMGVLGVIGYNVVLYLALSYTSATNASLVNALNPAVLVLFSMLFLRERLSKRQGAGLVVSLVGVLVILTQGNLLHIFQTAYNSGDLLMILAVLVWTFYSIISKKLSGVPPITATAISALFGVLLLVPFALYQGIDVSEISSFGLIGILYMALFPSVGSYMLWNIAVRHTGAGKAGISMNLIPVFTVLISLMLGESVTLVQLTGGLLVFLGVYLTTGMVKKRRDVY